jgi:hypothetical protein
MKVMRIISKMIPLLLVLAMTACENGGYPVIDDSEPLTGHWINPVYVDTLCQYERSASFKEDAGGIYFKTGNGFVERKNSGWCGTPPVSYANYDGTWTRKDSILNISVGYWGGIVDYEWKIISLSNNRLTLYRVKDTYNYTAD